MSIKTRRTIIFLLLITILALAAVSAYIAYRTKQDESTKDTLADTGGCCLNNCTCACWDGVGDEYRQAYCQYCKNQVYDSKAGACVSDGNNPDDDTDPDSCSITYPGGVTGYISIVGCTGTFEYKKYVQPASERGITAGMSESEADGKCVGISTNESKVDLGNGNHDPKNGAGCGNCVQYDRAGSGGVAGYTGDCTSTTTKCYRCTTILTDANACENKTVDGSSCPTGWSKNSKCYEEVAGDACATEETSTCGDGTVDSGEECDNGDQNGVVCTAQYGSECNYCSDECTLTSVKGPYCGDAKINGSEKCDPKANPNGCSNNVSCNNDCTCAVGCGGACTSSTDCPTNHTCTGNKCVLNGCTDTTCVNGCVPLCGGPCTTNANCPADHTCNLTTNKCVLNSCVNNPGCTNNGCTLPQTGLFDDSQGYLITGMILVLTSLLLYKLHFTNVVANTVTGSAKVRFVFSKTKHNFEIKRKEKFEENLMQKISKRKRN